MLKQEVKHIKMLTININDLPEYLKDSELSNTITVPQEYFTKEIVLNDWFDFQKLVEILQYWKVDNYPLEIFKFIDNLCDEKNHSEKKLLLNDIFWDTCYTEVSDRHLLEELVLFKLGTKQEDGGFLSSIIVDNRVELFKYFADQFKNNVMKKRFFNDCAENNQLEFIKIANGIVAKYNKPLAWDKLFWDQDTIKLAIENHHNEIAKYLFTIAIDNFEREISRVMFIIYNTCGQSGNLEMLKYIYENSNGKNFHNNYRFYDYVMRSTELTDQHFECIKYAREKGCQTWMPKWNVTSFWTSFEDESVCATTMAADRGLIKYLRFFRENNFNFYNVATKYAAKNNNLDVIKYLGTIIEEERILRKAMLENENRLTSRVKMYKHSFDWHISVCQHAAHNANVEMLKYLHQHGAKLDGVDGYWPKTLLVHGIVEGDNHDARFEFLKYAIENGAKTDSEACRLAAENNNLKCLKYLHENGCEWNVGTTIAAEEEGNFECLKYAIENGCPWSRLVDENGNPKSYVQMGKDLICMQYAIAKLRNSIELRKE